MEDLIIGMKVVKYVKSNAIVVVKDGRAVRNSWRSSK